MRNKIYRFIGTKIRPIELATFIKWLLRIRRQTTEIDGIVYFVDPISNFGIKLSKNRTYESNITRKIHQILDSGDTFVDLGGNEGYFSMIASKIVGIHGTVYCIEPQTRLHAIIMKNVNINGCYNIVLVPYVISDEKMECTLTLSPDINTGSSSASNYKRKLLWKRQSTFSTTLDELFLNKKIDSIKLMKIDIEGFEYLALKGATNLLKGGVIKNLIIETHPTHLKNLDQSTEMIEDLLNGYGYLFKDGIWSHLKHD